MNKAEKQAVVDDLAQRFQRAQIAICGDYRGLTVAQVTTLRKDLNKAGARAKVTKNTLGRLAVSKGIAGAKETELKRFLDILKGPSFVSFGDVDPVAPAKVISEFVKKNDKFKIKGAWVDGTFLDQKGIESLSKMPGKKETIAKLLALLNTPATQLLRLIKEPGAQVARVVEAQRSAIEKKGSAS